MSIHINDWRFCYDFIDLVPVEHLLDTLAYYKTKEQKLQNDYSYTHALGWATFFSSFGSKADYKQYLPYPHLANDGVESKKEYSDPTPETLELLRQLLTEGKLPRVVVLCLASIGVLSQIDQKN